MHAPSGTRVYRESDDDLPGPVPGEVAVGPGCPVASAAEMKELIYLPESYNSLSTCIHTLSLVYLTGPPVPRAVPTVCRTRLFLFPPLPSPAPSPPFSPSRRLRPYQLYLNFSPYPPLSAMRLGRLFPLCTFRTLFAWLYMRIISERPCPWRTWLRLRNLVSNLFSLPPLLRFCVYASVTRSLPECLYADICARMRAPYVKLSVPHISAA